MRLDGTHMNDVMFLRLSSAHGVEVVFLSTELK